MKNENKVYELLILYKSFKNMYFRNNPKKKLSHGSLCTHLFET